MGGPAELGQANPSYRVISLLAYTLQASLDEWSDLPESFGIC